MTSRFDSGHNSTDPARFLLWGVVLLQVVVLLCGLVIVWPRPPEDSGPDRYLYAEREAPALPPEPPPPTPLPPTPSPAPSPTPTAGPGTAWRIRGLELTQGIQVFHEPEDPRCRPDPGQPDYIFCNNSIPLVAGRHTLIRLYVACHGPCPTADLPVQLRLRGADHEPLILNGHIPAAMIQRVNNLPLPELRYHLENSINFELFPPPAWLAGPVTFEVAAAGQSFTLRREFVIRKPLRIAYLPIQYQGAQPPEPPQVDYWLRRMYPVPDVEYYRLPVPDMVWDGPLEKGELLRQLLYTYWLYAHYRSAEGLPDQLFGWLPQQFYNGGISDPYWCPHCAGMHSSRVAFGGLRPEPDIGGPRILVHEIAHNLGARHAWTPTQTEDALCFRPEGVDIEVDPAWPYPNTPHIQEVGLDLYSDPPVIYPPSFYDMMAYCYRPWISPHTYRTILDSPFLQPGSSPSPVDLSDESGVMFVSGIVYRDGTLSRPEVVQLGGDGFTAGGFAPPPGDDYCLETQAEDNSRLARHCFEVGFWDMETGQTAAGSPYFFVLPRAEETARISLTKNGTPLTVIEPSNHPPELRLIYPNGGERLTGRQTIHWQATDADGDPLRYDLLYSPDGGGDWLPLATRLDQTRYTVDTAQLAPTESGLIRVIAADGFHTTADESDRPFALLPPPENSLTLRGPDRVRPGQQFEIAVIANRMTGPGLFGIQFRLAFDPVLFRAGAVRLHPDLSLVVEDRIDNDTGQISIIATRQGRVDNLTGDLTLATITFVAAAQPGEAHFDLGQVKAGARGGLPLEISRLSGLSVHIAE